MKRIFMFLFWIASLKGHEGTWINPLTDVCWECVLPITICGVNVSNEQDFATYNKKICICEGIPPKVGIPITFWEPTRLVDVTRHAYKLLGLGGISIGKESVKNRGSIGILGDGPAQNSFYHVHWYHYPLFALLSMFTDFVCVEKGDLDMGYLSELDPLWSDDQLAIIMNGEAGIYGIPSAQIACIADCTAASFDKPLDALNWCAGCQGSLYPFTGTVAHHTGSLQASSLLVHRIIAKLHRSYALKGFAENEFCEAKYMPFIKKCLYKTQIVYPVPQTKGPCHALGKTDLLWGLGKTYPFGGEDFVYLIWTKKQCCLTGGL